MKRFRFVPRSPKQDAVELTPEQSILLDEMLEELDFEGEPEPYMSGGCYAAWIDGLEWDTVSSLSIMIGVENGVMYLEWYDDRWFLTHSSSRQPLFVGQKYERNVKE